MHGTSSSRGGGWEARLQGEEAWMVYTRNPNRVVLALAQMCFVFVHSQSMQAHFVRCIKPNTNQAANSFVGDFVNRQLRYTGAYLPVVAVQTLPLGRQASQSLSDSKLQGYLASKRDLSPPYPTPFVRYA